MQFLADESCDFAVVRALRSAGHDVLAVSEFQRRSVDRDLMEMAYAEGRILLAALGRTITRLVAELGSKLRGSFVVLRPGSVRISSIPPSE
jgi:hypothetical protein